MACVHKDAKGFETIVNVDIAGEKFATKGLIVLERNYLDVYIYENWNAKEISDYKVGDTFLPTVLDIVSRYLLKYFLYLSVKNGYFFYLKIKLKLKFHFAKNIFNKTSSMSFCDWSHFRLKVVPVHRSY